MNIRLIPKYPPETSPEPPTLIQDQDNLRIVIGLLGISLPILLGFGLAIIPEFSHPKPLESISHYFYTRLGSIFVTVMGLLGVFLLVYKGKRKADYIYSAIAGIAALCVVLFPTSNLDPDLGSVAITRLGRDDDNTVRINFHYISATIFLFFIAIMSFFRFSEPNSSDEKPNLRDRRIYRICGVIIVLAMAVISVGKGLLGKGLEHPYFDYPNPGTFWAESDAVWAFGYSWLVKAGFFARIGLTESLPKPADNNAPDALPA